MRTTPYEIYVHEIYGADSRTTPHQVRDQKGLREIKHYLVADTFRSLWFTIPYVHGVFDRIGLILDKIYIWYASFIHFSTGLDLKLIKYKYNMLLSSSNSLKWCSSLFKFDAINFAWFDWEQKKTLTELVEKSTLFLFLNNIYCWYDSDVLLWSS